MQTIPEEDSPQVTLTVPNQTRNQLPRPSLLRANSRKSTISNADDDEKIQLKSKITDLQAKIMDYQSQIFQFESLLNRVEMDKSDILNRLSDRLQFISDLEKELTDLRLQNSSFKQDLEKYLKVEKRKKILRAILHQERLRQNNSTSLCNSEKILLNRIDSLNYSHQVEVEHYNKRIEQLENKLNNFSEIKKKLQVSMEQNVELEQQLDLAQSQLLRIESENTSIQQSKKKARRSTLNQNDILSQISGSLSNQNDQVTQLQNDLIKHQRISQWEKEQLTNRVNQLEQQILELNQQLDEKPKAIREELELATQLLLQSEAVEHQKSIQQLQRRHTLQQMKQEQQMNSIEVFVEAQRKDRLHQLEKQQMQDRISALETEILQMHNRPPEEEDLRQQLEQAQSNIYFLEHELQSHKQLVQTQKRRLTVNLESSRNQDTDIRTLIKTHEQEKKLLQNRIAELESSQLSESSSDDDETHELQEKIVKLEKLNQMERDQFQTRIAQLENEILELSKQLEERPQAIKQEIELAAQVLLQSEAVEHQKSLQQMQRRHTLQNYHSQDSFVEQAKKDRLHELEKKQLQDQIVKLETELLELTHNPQDDNMQQQLEEVQSTNYLLLHELQTLRQQVQSQQRRLSLNTQDLSKILLHDESEQLRNELKKQERLHTLEKEELQSRIIKLEQEVLAQKHESSKPELDTAFALYQHSEEIEIKKNLQKAQRRLTLQYPVRINDFERMEQRNREILETNYESELNIELEEAKAKILALEHELQVERQKHQVAPLQLDIKNFHSKQLSYQSEAEIFTLRNEISNLTQQQQDFQQDIIQKFEQLRSQVSPESRILARSNNTSSPLRQKHPGYEGTTLGFMRHGQGYQRYEESGCTYEGLFRFDKRHGFGELRDSNGDLLYRGEWAFDEMNGQGELINKQCLVVESQYQTQQPSSLKHFSWAKYVGGFQRGGKYDLKQKLDFHGEGKILFPNGDVYEGNIEHGIPHGSGKYQKADGKQVLYGKWQGGKLISCEY